ncbi:cytosine permease [Streptomyces sp. NPDC060286]|uniref:cytosine permease n=1 Tax=unclassified Streptomyces TaxID=2593676 RepID=UPI0035DECDA5
MGARLIVFLVSGPGIRAVRACRIRSMHLFACFSAIVLIHPISRTDRHDVLDRPAGSTAMVISGIGTLVGGGISWVPAGPDFARHPPRTVSGGAPGHHAVRRLRVNGGLRRRGRDHVDRGPRGGAALPRCGVVLRPVRRLLDRAPRTGPGGHDRRLCRAVRDPAAPALQGSGSEPGGDASLHF